MSSKRKTVRKNTNKPNGSRRTRKGATVESLHVSFDKIAEKVQSLIQKGSTDSDLACCLRTSWSEQFRTDLSHPAIKGLILHYRAIYGEKGGKGRKTRKSRIQNGGMAPMDWTMSQGSASRVYGSFPVEMGTSHQVVKALDNSRFFENRGGRSCDTTGGHGAQVGGGLLDALKMGHAPGSVPRNGVEIGVSAGQGAPIMNPPSSPISSTIQLASYTPRAFDAGAISNISSLSHVYAGY